MPSKKILETERLVLYEFNIDDAEFIFEIVNTPNWLKFIGNKNVNSIDEARKYLEDGPIKSYNKNGFGLWRVQLKETNIPIGMCGLLNRETLDPIDIGFALLPEYVGNGYAFEAANATMGYAKNNLKIDKIIATTNHNNDNSIKLLKKIGLQFEGVKKRSENDTVMVFSSTKSE